MGLLWASAEYSPYAILIVARDHARIAVAYLGGVAIVDDQVLHLDPSDWRFKSGRVRTATRQAGVSAGRGTQRDAFDARIDAEHRKFWHEVAVSTTRDLSERGIDRLILAGPEEATSEVRAALPASLKSRIVARSGWRRPLRWRRSHAGPCRWRSRTVTGVRARWLRTSWPEAPKATGASPVARRPWRP
jgi:hypothetical protein